jgi:hypothetical protein
LFAYFPGEKKDGLTAKTAQNLSKWNDEPKGKMTMSIDTLSNCHYDRLKEARNIKVQEPMKPFDPLRIYAKQSEIKKSSNIAEHLGSIMKELYSKSENIIEERFRDEIKQFEKEIREIDKKLDPKEFGSKIKDEEKKQLEERKKAIGDKLEKLNQGKKAEIEKMFGHILVFYKTFNTIKETSRLTEKQFKQNLTVASTLWLYNSLGRVDQGIQDLVKTLMKLVAEQKL